MKFKVFLLIILIKNYSWAGPFSPAANEFGSSAIHADSPSIIGWAINYDNFHEGFNLYEEFKTPNKALNKAGNSDGNQLGFLYDIVSLGEGGSITLLFDPPIENGDGFDFVVFENSFSDNFLELAWVEVSSNGIDFIRFENFSLTPSQVSPFGFIDPTNINGLAGKYKQGYGTPFDLQSLKETGFNQNLLNIDQITHIKIIDIIGDGGSFDSFNRPIFDPYPTNASSGFDLDAIGVINQSTTLQAVNVPLPVFSISILSILFIYIKKRT